MMDGETNPPPRWVCAWYAAPTRTIAAHLAGRTLRQIVHPHAGCEQLRLRLTNRYGDAPVTLGSVSVAPAVMSAMDGPGSTAVKFEGRTTVTLEPGQEVASDPVPLQFRAFSDLAITFYVAQGDCLTGHIGAQQTSNVSGVADVTGVPPDLTMLAYPLLTSSWWVITGVDVVPSAPLNAVVAFGSSTTDGAGSTPNTNRRWPDYLARRLRDAGGTRFMSVLNAGIGGNQLTSSDIPLAFEEPGGTGVPPMLFGEAGIRRLSWDALAQPGATDLIVHIGSNDLRFGVPSAALIEALQHLASEARPTYRQVFGTTILPGGYAPEHVEQRRRVNRWLREQGSQWFDAIFDFAAPLASPADEAALNPAYDSGDGVHPNDEGYRLMAEAVDLSRLTGSPAPPSLRNRSP